MPTLLKRIDPEAHINRWYFVTVQPTLFHPVAVVSAWGSRENDYQRVKILAAGSAAEAEELAAKIVAAKVKRGYEVVAASGGETAVVTRIIDGDTIEVNLNGAAYGVRYIGMGTPEHGHPFKNPNGKHNASGYTTPAPICGRRCRLRVSLECVIWRGVGLVANSGVETCPWEGALVAKVDSSDEYGRCQFSFR